MHACLGEGEEGGRRANAVCGRGDEHAADRTEAGPGSGGRGWWSRVVQHLGSELRLPRLKSLLAL